MAKEIEEIALEIKEAFVNNEVLERLYELTPGASYDAQFSNASVETCLIYEVATAIKTVYWLFDMFKQDMEESVRRAIPGSLSWYWNKVKEFRFGYDLDQWGLYSSEVYELEPTITFCSIIEDYNGLTVKVNKSNYAVLTTAEKTAFTSYINKVKFAGTNISIVSLPPDELTLFLKVVINPLLLTPEYGRTGEGASTDDLVALAVEKYLQDMKYGGVFNKTKLIDAIQQVEGVEDVVINNCVFDVKDASNTTVTLNEQNYTSASGAIKLKEIVYE